MDSKDAVEREAKCYECGLVIPPALVQCPRCGEVKPFPVVSAVQSRLEPYPYVHVNPDGTFRELSDAERDYLETPFHPFDGARPYVKSAYSDRDGWGSIEGPCLRSALPENPQQGSAPSATPPTPAMTKDGLTELYRGLGCQVDATPNGIKISKQSATGSDSVAGTKKAWWRLWK